MDSDMQVLTAIIRPFILTLDLYQQFAHLASASFYNGVSSPYNAILGYILIF